MLSVALRWSRFKILSQDVNPAILFTAQNTRDEMKQVDGFSRLANQADEALFTLSAHKLLFPTVLLMLNKDDAETMKKWAPLSLDLADDTTKERISATQSKDITMMYG